MNTLLTTLCFQTKSSIPNTHMTCALIVHDDHTRVIIADKSFIRSKNVQYMYICQEEEGLV